MSSENAPSPAPERATNPHDLVKRCDVEQALKADKGEGCVLDSFAIQDFTHKGDNYACVVSSVAVNYKREDKLHDTSYVVKLNPCRTGAFDQMTGLMFDKEIGFYTQILPMVNTELERLNEPKLRTPRYLHSVNTPDEQVIFLEDLRKDGFKMFDRQKSMDRKHTQLILNELARLHASSFTLFSRDEYKGVDIAKRFPVLVEYMDDMEKNTSLEKIKSMYDSFIENSAKIAERNKGYEFVGQFLRSKKETIYEEYSALLKASDKFAMICHGDCWNNNFLFRYDKNGSPQECRLLDFQICRYASPALDMNYMFYCSLDGSVRQAELDSFFANYYATFASIVAAAGLVMKFTLPEITKEFYAKNLFGLLMATVLIPIVLSDSEDAPSFDDYKGDDMEKAMLQFQDKLMDVIQVNPLLAPRFLSMFDEMEISGLLNRNDFPSLTESIGSLNV